MKTSLLYGFLNAVAGFLLLLVLFLAGLHSDPAKLGTASVIGGVGGLAIGAAFIALGVRARRDETPAGEAFGYGSAFGAGLGVAAVASLLSAPLNYLYFAVINPRLSDLVVQAQVDKLTARGLSSEQIDRAESMIRSFSGPGFRAGAGLVASFIIGAVIALIVAAVLKRPAEQPPLV